MTYTPEQRRTLLEARTSGLSIRRAAASAKMSESGAQRFLKGYDSGLLSRQISQQANFGQPKTVKHLSSHAKRALEDFGYFQRRYFGRVEVPWQTEAATRIVEYLESPEEEYVVVNAPPGSGKTTCFTLDIPAWLTVRDRSIRGLIGSATGKLAERNTARLRRALESSIPNRAEAREIERGLAFDAEATLASDFGRFKPVEKDVWRVESFVVMQADGTLITEKEPTWSAYGRDQEFLGGRYDFVIWDDLVVPKRLRNLQMVEDDRQWYDTYAETRLEPGGLFVLQGQRFGPEDLYRYALDKSGYTDDDEIDDFDVAEATMDLREGGREGRKYHHIVFKAHYDDLCQGDETHRRGSPAYPFGCLLDPTRLSAKRLFSIRKDGREWFETVYQQEDVDPASVLVHPDWINGVNGWPGCWDHTRDRLEVPKGLSTVKGSPLSVLTADPSPTMWWAIEWWVYHPDTEQRFLVDLYRKKMEAPDFLDWNLTTQKFTGLLEEWYETSVAIGHPITHVIVEINAAQRFLLQYDLVRRWMALRSVQVIPHSTHRNKSDPDYGVQSIAPHYQFGRVRLPGKPYSQGKANALSLAKEVTHYPQSSTSDCLMAQWFFEWQLPHIFRPPRPAAHAWRPSWAAGDNKTMADKFMADRVKVPTG